MTEIQTPAQDTEPNADDRPTADPMRGLIVPMVLLLSLAVVAIIAVAWFAAERLDHETENRDVALARTALEAEATRLVFLTRDLTYWDVAYEELVVRANPVWADDNIGSYATDTSRISHAIILSADGETRMVFEQGELVDATVEDFVASDLIADLTTAANAAPMDEPVPIVRYAAMGGLIHTIVASAFTPESPTDEQLVRKPRAILILASPVDSEFLAHVSRSFLLDDPAVSMSLPTGERVYAPISPDDTWATAYITWDPSRPGTRLREDLLIPIVVSLLAIILLAALYARRLARARREAEAISQALDREVELRELKSRFISTVSHEMRTPLATIQAATDLLSHFSDRLTPEEAQRELDTIRDRVRDMDALLGEALLLEKGETQRQAPEPIDLPAMIQTYWRNRLPSEGRTLLIEDGRTSPAEVRYDRRLLQQILGNLLQNALKYSGADQPVTARIATNADVLMISVVDQGIGIPPKDLHHVREPFSRAGNVEHVGGVGFGLSIVDRAVAMLGGTFELKSELGAGTTAMVSLPLNGTREKLI